MTQVKGTKISSKIDFVRQAFGDAVLREVLQSLDPGMRERIEAVVDVGWYPIELYVDVVDGILQVVGGDREALLERIGRESAELLAEGSYRRFFESRDPVGALREMVPIHGMLNRPASMEISRRAGSCLEIVVAEPRSTPTQCRIARAFYRRAVELCGVSSATVEELACTGLGDQACRFEVRWTP